MQESYADVLESYTIAEEGILTDDNKKKIAKKTKEETNNSEGSFYYNNGAITTKYGRRTVGNRKYTDEWVERFFNKFKKVIKPLSGKFIPKLTKMLLELNKGLQYAESNYKEYSNAYNNKDTAKIKQMDETLRKIFAETGNIQEFFNELQDDINCRDAEYEKVDITENEKRKLKEILIQFKNANNKFEGFFTKTQINDYYSKSMVKKVFTKNKSTYKKSEKLSMYKECRWYIDNFINRLENIASGF